MPDGGPPFTESIDGDITGVYGFKDGHVELAIKLPAPLSIIKSEYRHSFTEKDFHRLKTAVDRIAKWYELSPEDRERLGSP